MNTENNVYLGILLALLIGGLLYSFVAMGKQSKVVYRILESHKQGIQNCNAGLKSHKVILENILKAMNGKNKKGD